VTSTEPPDPLWPDYRHPDDLRAIEAVPLAERGLPESTYALLTRAATAWPEHTALTVLPDAVRWREPARRTYAELLGDVHRAANLLRGLGVRRSSAVALVSPNCDELITATLAAQTAGIAAPINGGLSGEHIAELLRRSGARVLVTAGPELDAGLWSSARELAGEGGLDVLLALRPTKASGSPPPLAAVAGVRVAYLSELTADERDDRFVGALPRPGDLAALFHTGGTTGAPKLAAHTHANEVADAWMIAAHSMLDHPAVVFAALPLFHVNALVVTLLAPMLRGQIGLWAGPLGYRDPALFGEFWKIVAEYRVTAMSAVPTVYAGLARIPVDADISSLRFAIVGASPLPSAVRDQFETHTGVPLVEGYGLTEATCANARSFPDSPRPGSVGQRLPYQRVKVVRVDDAGDWHDLPAGGVGVLAIGGPTVFPGYVTGHRTGGEGPAHVLDGLGTLRGGWLNTGDLARVDADGFVYLTGRAKDLIIRGGHNIDPTVIEDALLSHPAVHAAAAVGRPDPHAGEVPVAYVALGPGATVGVEELRSWAAERVGERAAVPREVVVLDALPLTSVGKPYKVRLRADATRRAVTEALSALPGRVDVDAVEQDGAVVVSLSAHGVDRAAVERALADYTIPYRWEATARP
jgi:fatty-acyl-CoA synthase